MSAMLDSLEETLNKVDFRPSQDKERAAKHYAMLNEEFSKAIGYIAGLERANKYLHDTNAELMHLLKGSGL